MKNINIRKHVTGRSIFVGDESNKENLLYIKIIPSQYAYARIVSMDLKKALESEGVIDIITYKDIPGKNNIGFIQKGEPVFAKNYVYYIGQPIGAIIANSFRNAEKALKYIKIKYKELNPILTINQARRKNAYFKPVLKIKKGFNKKIHSDNVIKGIIESPSQEHFYLETQITRVYPDEGNNLTILTASQSPTEIQEIIAEVLNTSQKNINVQIRRLGGAFGGKEHGATQWAAIAAIACNKLKLPVELRLSRIEDMEYTGKRHEFLTEYEIGYNNNGKIIFAKFKAFSNGGAYADLSVPVLERFVLNIDGIYNIENFSVIAKAMKTNLPPNTAFRGFGAPQAVFAIENIIDIISKKLNKSKFEIMRINTYKEKDYTPYRQRLYDVSLDYMINTMEKYIKKNNIDKKIKSFNKKHKYKKLAYGIVPVKFGISFSKTFLNQGYALIVFYNDGSISVSTGAVEMGQEASTRIAQIVSIVSGVSINKIKIEKVDTKIIANIPPTAASTTIDLNGNAAYLGTMKIIKRLKSIIIKENKNIKESDIVFKNNYVFIKNKKYMSLSDIIIKANQKRIKLIEHSFYKTPNIFYDSEKGVGSPFSYFVYGIAYSLVEMDLLTNYFTIKDTKIIHETGKILNKAIEMGQIEGAYIQSVGWLTTEKIIRNNKGKLLTNSPSTYKIPTIFDIPEKINIKIIEKKSKYSSIFYSKGIGEPPFLYGESVYLGLRKIKEKGKDFIF